MNNRRSFLKMLGLSAVAAPAAVQALQVEAAPVSAIAIRAEWRRTQHWRTTELIEAQRELNRMRSAQLAALADPGEPIWLDWAKNATHRA